MPVCNGINMYRPRPAPPQYVLAMLASIVARMPVKPPVTLAIAAVMLALAPLLVCCIWRQETIHRR